MGRRENNRPEEEKASWSWPGKEQIRLHIIMRGEALTNKL